jgi:hypothetical protein
MIPAAEAAYPVTVAASRSPWRRFDVVILPHNALRRTITGKPAHQGSSEDFFS